VELCIQGLRLLFKDCGRPRRGPYENHPTAEPRKAIPDLRYSPTFHSIRVEEVRAAESRADCASYPCREVQNPERRGSSTLHFTLNFSTQLLRAHKALVFHPQSRDNQT
jgi:hypothetical protein